MIVRRNCISEYSKIKICIPKDYLNFLKNENNDIDSESKSRNKMKLLNNLKLTDIRGKIINTKDVKIKIIQDILNKKSFLKCQDKWNIVYNEEFPWPTIWINLKRLDISSKIKEFQWKCIRFSLIWSTFENFIVSHGQHANFLPESYLIDFIAIDCCFSTSVGTT